MSTPNAPPASSEITARLELARAAALEAGQLTLRYFQTADLAVERKADDSPVTVADRGAEQLLRQRIAERFAADGILGEEFGETPGTSGYRWILDPIDGTKSFISGVPLYGTMVAVERDGEALLGVVYIPGLDECIHAAIGPGRLAPARSRPAHQSAQVSSRDKFVRRRGLLERRRRCSTPPSSRPLTACAARCVSAAPGATATDICSWPPAG